MISTTLRAGLPPDPFEFLANEIRAGIVLHLDPDSFETHGGKFCGREGYRVQGCHFFLCASHGDGFGLWLPVFTNPGPGRIRVPAKGRRGHPKWLNGEAHIHTRQRWDAPVAAVVQAARDGGELSVPGRRNWADTSWLPPEFGSQARRGA